MANSSINMSESLGMTSSEPRELKLGPSFLNQRPLYHTIRYDFKPASVDLNKMATVEVNDKNSKEVLVTVPHADGAGVTHTVFKGNQSPIRRDCVLIIDKVTGEITLEKLHTSIIVKKTRPESSAKLSLPHLPDVVSSRKLSPKHIRGRGNASPKTPGLGCIPKHSPLHASPNPSLPIIGEEVDPGYEASTSVGHGYGSTDLGPEPEPSVRQMPPHPVPQEPSRQSVMPQEPSRQSAMPQEPSRQSAMPQEPSRQSAMPQEPSKQMRSESVYKTVVSNSNGMEDLVGVLSDSSSGDSSSDVDSSDSSSEEEMPPSTNQGRPSGTSLPSAVTLLSHDLQLSDSGSDLD